MMHGTSAARLAVEGLITVTTLVGTGILIYTGRISVGDAGWVVGPVIGYWFTKSASSSTNEQTIQAMERTLNASSSNGVASEEPPVPPRLARG